MCWKRKYHELGAAGAELKVPTAETQRFPLFKPRVARNLFLATVKRQKPAWFGHVTRHDSLSKTILQGASEVGDAMVRRRNADGEHQRLDIPTHARAAHKDR